MYLYCPLQLELFKDICNVGNDSTRDYWGCRRNHTKGNQLKKFYQHLNLNIIPRNKSNKLKWFKECTEEQICKIVAIWVVVVVAAIWVVIVHCGTFLQSEDNTYKLGKYSS